MTLSNLKPRILSDVLENVDELYSYINNKDNPRISEGTGYFAYFLDMPQRVRDRLIGIAISETMDQEIDFTPKDIGFHIARYTLDSNFPPKLDPHTDKFVEYPCVIISIQLDSNISWPLAVNEDVYELDRNQAIIFSGSHQIHWRPEREFKDGEYIDVLLCTIMDTSEQLTKKHLDDMERERINFTFNNEVFKRYCLS